MRLKELRVRSKTSQQKLADFLNVSRSTIAMWELGKSEPSNDTISRIADYFHVSVDYLLGRTDYPKKLLNVVDIGDYKNIELVANIHAGYTGAAIADVSEIISVPTRMLKGYAPEECKAFIVKGDSMYPEYKDGDYLIVHVQPSVDSGDIAIIIYNGDEATVKKVKYVHGEDWLELVPINPEYMPKRIEGADIQECFVYGKVISMMRL